MTSAVAAIRATCDHCPPEHQPLSSARHTLLDGDSTAPMCSSCLIQLIIATDRYGSRVTVSITPARRSDR